MTKIIFFADDNARASVLEWLNGLPKKPRAKGIARIFRLEECGFELRRPEADYVQDGVYELRWALGRVNYRILYFFHGREVVVLAHGLTKEDVIPASDLKIAVLRKRSFERNPIKHTFQTRLDNE